jgi:uncharacterized protein (DUF1697 family)
MEIYIALFRGINVGGNRILPMKVLKKLLEKIGCDSIRTYIQSGNVVFRTDIKQRAELSREISAAIQHRFGFAPKVLLLGQNELQKVLDDNPFKTTEGKTLHFYFLDATPENPDLDHLKALKSPSEEFTLKKNIFYLYAPDGIGRSKLAAKVEQVLGVAATARNWNTVRKLLEMTGQDI